MVCVKIAVIKKKFRDGKLNPFQWNRFPYFVWKIKFLKRRTRAIFLNESEPWLHLSNKGQRMIEKGKFRTWLSKSKQNYEEVEKLHKS